MADSYNTSSSANQIAAFALANLWNSTNREKISIHEHVEFLRV